jgi:signal transduction histidine kinase
VKRNYFKSYTMKIKYPSLFIFLLFFSLTASADNYIDSLRIAKKTETDEISRYHAMTLLAGEIMPANMDSAKVFLESASMLANAVDHPQEMTAWLNISGNYNWYTGNIDSAIVNYNMTYRLESPDILDRRAAAAVNLGALYNAKGMLDDARYFHNKAREFFIELDDQAGLAHVNRSLGVAYFRQNNYELALRHHLEAMEYQESVQDTFALVYAYDSMGNVLKNLNDNEQAEEYFIKAISFFEDFPKTPNIGSVYNNLATFYEGYSDEYPDISIKYAKMGLETLEKYPNLQTEFSLYSNLGMFYYDKGDYATSREWFEKAFALDQQRVDPYLVSGQLYNYARLLVGERKYQEARRQFQESIEIAQNVRSFSRQEAGYRELFRLDSLLGNYNTAIAHLQESNRFRDSIWQQDRADRISELRILHEIDQKEAENAMLRESNLLKEEVISKQRHLMLLGFSAITLLVLLIASLLVSKKRIQSKKHELEIMHAKLKEKQTEVLRQNELLDKKNQELEVLNQTKDKFFSIISHDLKGPFNSLLGFLNILVENSDEMDQAQRHEILKSLKYSSERTYDMLTNLLEWSTIQRGKMTNNPEQTFIRSLIDECLLMLDHDMNKKDHAVVIEADHTLSANIDLKLLKSIMINLINNAIKFTHRGGLLNISAKKSSKKNTLVICVKDNGIGIPADQISSLFQLGSGYRRQGTEREMGTGLGLITIKEIVSLMDGDISIESEPGKGSTFCITIPISE